MKKIIFLIAILLTLSPNTKADICYDISKDVAETAVNILNNQQEIYSYCSICPNAEPQKIIINKVQKGNPILINDKPIDLAHTYIKEDNHFINLGVISSCIKEEEYNIKLRLEELSTKHQTKENDIKEAQKKAKNFFQDCYNKSKIEKEFLTTEDMMFQNKQTNECLTNIIKQEILTAFHPEQQQEMLSYLEQTQTSIYKIYDSIYAKNKYCYGQCGTITNILPYVDENTFLMQLLEKLLYLNISQNRY